MRVERLRLTDFRNYRELDLTLPGGLVIFSGRNAQGKSNLLEAVSLIATTRSFRTATEREAVRWDAAGRFARIVGDVVRRQDTLEIEVILAEAADENARAGAEDRAPGPAFRKRVRVNGAPRRAMDLVGMAPVVVFAPTDLDLVIGGPSDRRRLLDLTLCQTNRQYCRTLSQYQKVVAQRGALLRRIRDQLESPQSLDYWDDQLTRLALPLIRERAAFLTRATSVAARIYARLARADSEQDAAVKVQANGDVSANLATQEFAAKKFTLNASGVRVKDKFNVAIDAPSLNLTKDNYSAVKLTLKANMDGAFGNVVASLTMPGVEGNAESFKVSALTLDLDVKQPEQAFKVKLGSPLSGNIKAQQFNLSNLSVAVTATGDKLPNKSVSSEMKGSVQVDALKQTVQANLAGGLLQSQIKARVGVKDFADLAIKFDVDVDQFDADLYMPKKSAEAARKSQSAEPEQPLDLSGLRKLNLDGSLRIGALKVMNVKSSQLHMDVKALNGQLNINPLTAKLYQGSLNGSLSVNAQATPSFVIKQKLNGVNIAPLLKDAADLELAEGKGNIALDLTTQGNTVSALKKALDGSVSVNLANGAIKGINLTKLVQGIQNLGKDTRVQTLGVDKSEKTEFSEFKANFKVNNGVAHNDDLAVKSTVLRLSGNGDIDIGHDSVNYNAKATLAKTEQGRTATLPVNVSGPFDALKFKVDYGALIVDVAKQKIDEKKEKLKEDAKAKLQEELKKSLKGLFK